MSTESDGYISFGVGLLFGVSIGAILGLLLTPKSGKEMRSDLCQLTKEVPEVISSGVDNTKDKCSDMIDKARYVLDKQIHNINDSLKAGKMAAAKKREELEDGLAGY